MPVFITLIECDPKDQNARYHAQLGFSLKDMLPADLINAKTELDKAIAIRDRLKQGDKYVYEFARAFANIQLGSKNDVIKKDLEAAMNDPMLRDRI